MITSPASQVIKAIVWTWVSVGEYYIKKSKVSRDQIVRKGVMDEDPGVYLKGSMAIRQKAGSKLMDWEKCKQQLVWSVGDRQEKPLEIQPKAVVIGQWEDGTQKWRALTLKLKDTWDSTMTQGSI